MVYTETVFETNPMQTFLYASRGIQSDLRGRAVFSQLYAQIYDNKFLGI